MSSIFTACKRSLGQGNIFRSVCQEFCSWGVCLSECWDTTSPQDQAGTPVGPGRHPPGQGTPGADTSPKADTPLGPGTPRDQTPPRPVTPQEQTPPGTPPRDQAPLPPAQSMVRESVNERAVCILLECILAHTLFADSRYNPQE